MTSVVDRKCPRLWIENVLGFPVGSSDSVKRFADLKHVFLEITNSPAPAIMAGREALLYIEDADVDHGLKPRELKPPYQVPTMADIRALPWNGLTVASTFSGAGGSCTGYRMAGYKVLWANEFLPMACESYRANHPESILDGRDIHIITPKDILTACHLQPGELDILDGSPPCQAFSMAGQRSEGWGTSRKYENGTQQKNEELFPEYIRLLRGLKPRAFIAENVSGLVKGVAKGYFKDILRELKASGYRVSARLLDAQWLGVPQARQRIIFIGVREDLNCEPAHPEPLKYQYTVADALPWLRELRMRTASFESKSVTDVLKRPMPTVCTTAHWSGFKSDAVLKRQDVVAASDVIHDSGNFVQNVPIAGRPCPAITNGIGGLNSTHFLVAGEGSGDTVTGRRPDGIERRKFTIEELKRICAFPDDYILKGSYAQQWERLGNSVPPVMMAHIAATLRDQVFRQAATMNNERTQAEANVSEADRGKPRPSAVKSRRAAAGRRSA